MSRPPTGPGPDDDRAALHQSQHRAWRDPARVIDHPFQPGPVDPRLFQHRVQGPWWDILDECKITLLLTREHEHLILALRPGPAAGRVSYLSIPHPSGLAVDLVRGVVHVASTRNPNQVFDLMPVSGTRDRFDHSGPETDRELVPVRSRFYPGCLYLHDLALIGGELFANAVGENAVVRLGDDGRAERAWWPRCIEAPGGPLFGRNHIQLNSIAPGPDLAGSFFSASSSRVSRRRPGHLNYPVDGQGVIFSGASREPIATGLTRPHSARLDRGTVWVDNSGYGELGIARDGRFEAVARLPGWTRGLCILGDLAFVGTSRVIPKYRAYAPGLDVDSSHCGIHAVDLRTGAIRAGLTWPYGNQVFAIDWLPAGSSGGFPWLASRDRPGLIKKLFYAYDTEVNR